MSSRVAFGILALIALAAAAVWALRPQPVQVDFAEARIAPMEVTVSAEGITRIREPFAVVAPVTGTTTRSPVEVGDSVVAGETVVAVIQPAEPAILDARTRAQAEAAVTEAQAAVRLAEVSLSRAEADLAYAESQLARNRALADRGIIAQRILEDSVQMATTARAAVEAARFELDLHRATLARAQAQLYRPADPLPANPPPGECCLRITAPKTGKVLEVTDVSARLVPAGSQLMTIGDPGELEIEVDLLSSDAVRVMPGARAHVDRWGGAGVLEAAVRRIDPSAFTRVSALGIEEQRVRVRLDILTPAEARAGLGDRYRVYVSIVVWSADAVLQVPQSVLFRHEGGWAVFREDQGRAVLTAVEIGQQTEDAAEVLSGLNPGDRLVAYPANRVSAGDPVAARSQD